MRLWPIHPRYLDWKGLGALWREGILAQAVLAGETTGWKKHPQLDRFKLHPRPLDAVGFYLLKVREEASARGYSYDGSKIRRPVHEVERLPITRGQLDYEFGLLFDRTRLRTPAWHEGVRSMKDTLEAHPIFYVVEGEPAAWEISYWGMVGEVSKPSLPSHHRAMDRSRSSQLGGAAS